MTSQIRLKVLALGAALVLPSGGWAEVNFAQKPLAAGGGVDPNLMFMLDDSGSMAWEFMPDNLSGDHVIPVPYGAIGQEGQNSNNPYYYSSRVNKVWYNPQTTYLPPLKADGTGRMANSSFSSAAFNGYDSNSTTHNLSNDFRTEEYNRIEGGAFYWEFNSSTECEANPRQDSCYTFVSVDNLGADEKTNFANWYSYYRTREMAAKAGIGNVFGRSDLSTDFRLGWGQINRGYSTVDGATGIKAVREGVRPFDDVRTDFLTWLYDVDSSGGTPLRSALEGAGRYYENSTRPWLDDPGSDKSITNPARECRISATMLMTDGYYGNDTLYVVENSDGSDGEEITNGLGEVGQYKAVPPFSDDQTAKLSDIAAYFWKRDLRSDIDNYVPTIEEVEDSANEGIREKIGNPAFWQHMMTYGIGFGVEGSVTRSEAVNAVINGTSVDWWGGNNNEDRINDLLHASMNGRGDFFSAGDPETFRIELEGLLDQFLGNAGSATGLDFNAGSIEAVDAALSFSSYFEPNGWSGDLEATTLVASDSGRPEQADPDGNGWSARAKLEGTDFDTRTVLTYDGGAGVPFRWASLSDAQKSDLEVGDPSLGALRVDYLRGKRKEAIESENSGTGQFFRDRTYLLGSIVNSTPRYVGVPDSNWPNADAFGDGKYTVFRNTNLDRTPVVYVGANDGMLHGFLAKNADDGGGQEVLAYVPSFVSSTADGEGLHNLTDPNYEHRYYVDLNLEVVDVYTKGRKGGGNGIDNTEKWRTVLIGGSRAGAKGIFALDVTEPDELSETNAAQTVLWEFTHPDLGYLVEPPEIAQMEWPDGKIRWTVFVPSGYNTDTTGFFMLDLEAGLDGEWSSGDYIYHEFDNAGSGLSPLTVVDNLNDDYLVDRVYAGDLEGRMWVAYNDAGTMRTAYTSGGSNVPYFKADQPITAAPGVGLGLAEGKDPNIMILFGTGKYLENGDISDTSDQYFYGVQETSDAGTLPLTMNDLMSAPVTSRSGTIDGATRDIRVASESRVDYDTKRGWYTQLPASGERIVNYPIVRGEYVYVNTLIPGANPCLGGGEGWVMGFEIVRAEGTTPGYEAFENSTEGASGFSIRSTPSQLAVWGNLLAFGTGGGGAEFIGLPEIVDGLGRKGWREMTE